MTDQAKDTGLGDEEYKKEAEAESQDEAKKTVKENSEEENPEGEEKKPEDEETEEEEEKKETFEDTDKPEIPVRQLQYIIGRQREKIKKLEAKKEEDEQTQLSEEEGEEVEETEVDRAVKRHLAPVLDTLKSQEDEKELAGLLSSHPEAKAYERSIRAYMKHPAWSQVPAEAIFHHLHYQNAVSTGAKQKEVADKEAKQMSTTGSQRRPKKVSTTKFPSAEQIDAMSDAELEELATKAKQGKFLEKE